MELSHWHFKIFRSHILAFYWNVVFKKLGALYTDKEKLHQTNERRFNNHCNYINNNTQNSIPAPLEFYEAEMTELGKVLAHLPLDPQLARLLLFGLALKCFNPVVTLVASLSHRDPCIFYCVFSVEIFSSDQTRN